MNPTIEILLKRMESNPEEFKYNPSIQYSKWGELYERYSHHLSEEDKQAYEDGIRALRLKDFHEEVLKTLLTPKDEESDLGKFKVANPSGMVMGGRPLRLSSSSTNPLWGTSAVEHTALHIEALQKLAEANIKTEKTMVERIKEKVFK